MYFSVLISYVLFFVYLFWFSRYSSILIKIRYMVRDVALDEIPVHLITDNEGRNILTLVSWSLLAVLILTVDIQ